MTVSVFDGAAWLERIRAQVRGRSPALIESMGGPIAAAASSLRDAAVLVPIVWRDSGLSLVLTKRPDTMRTHSGQIAFPGGRRDGADADIVACALREAEEEIGIEPAHVSVIGALDEIPTPTGFRVLPIVAEIASIVQPAARTSEVADVFEVSIASLRTPEVFVDHGERTFLNITQRVTEYRVGERRIWGLTARVIDQLLEFGESGQR